MIINQTILEIVKRHIKEHTRWCSYDNAPGDEGDCCSCDRPGRRIALYNDIAKLLGEKPYEGIK